MPGLYKFSPAAIYCNLVTENTTEIVLEPADFAMQSVGLIRLHLYIFIYVFPSQQFECAQRVFCTLEKLLRAEWWC